MKDYLKISEEKLNQIKPMWHTNLSELDLAKQPDSLVEKYINNGFHIYTSTWLALFSALNPSYEDLYKSKELWTDEQDEDKIARIIKHWDEDTKLIPPMLIDNGYDQLVPADGKHRMKVSSIIQPKEMTFILFDIDLPTINKYFNPTLLS
jgi:hypothetical protein